MKDNTYSVYLRFTRRLKKLGIEIECIGNYPWVYLRAVNGNLVKEKYMAEHGFTAFFMPARLGELMQFSDRRKVFDKVREML